MTKPKKPSDTVKALAAVHNMDRADINSDLHAGDQPLIALTDLSVTVQGLVKARQFDTAAAAIEIAVRRAYAVEGAS
jgi:hypothetical protein